MPDAPPIARERQYAVNLDSGVVHAVFLGGTACRSPIRPERLRFVSGRELRRLQRRTRGAWHHRCLVCPRDYW